MENGETERRMRRALAGLLLLSEAPAGSWDTDRVHGGDGRQVPAGLRLTEAGPVRDRGLHEHHAAAWRAAITRRDRWIAMLKAERDLYRVLRRRPDFHHENPDRREQRILTMYEGVDPLEAAFAEDCPPGWVRRVRRKHGRDETTGREPAHAAKTRRAAHALLSMLQSGERPAQDCRDELRHRFGYGERTIDRAKTLAHVTSRRHAGRWHWQAPAHNDANT